MLLRGTLQVNQACNGRCFDLRPHADPKYVVCAKCGEIYLNDEAEMDMTINEEYEYEKPGGFDHMST